MSEPEDLIHESIINAIHDGLPDLQYAGVLHKGCIEAAIKQAHFAQAYYQAELGIKPVTDAHNPLLVGAILLRSIAHDSCFNDGNKRTAWLSLCYVLEKHAECMVHAPTKEIEEFVVLVAKGLYEVPVIVEWVDQRLGPIPRDNTPVA